MNSSTPEENETVSEKQHSPFKVMIMAGGTGGHIFPGLAVAKELSRRGWQVCWLGTKERMEAQIVPQHGFNIRFIDVAGIRGNGLLRLLKAPFMVMNSIRQAMKIIKEEKPNVVLGLGGFASGPGGVAARLCGLPLMLHEQNAVPGMTNKILSKIAQRVLVAFPETDLSKRKEIVVGNPLRRELLEVLENVTQQVDDTNISEDEIINVLVVGGSLGAKVFNEELPKVFAKVEQTSHCHILHQTGRGNREAVASTYQQELPNISVDVVEFIDDMAQAYQAADLIICRAGALTVSEVAAVGRAAIFVPFPAAVDDHQTKNAGWLAAHGAAKIIQQKDMLSGELELKLNVLLTKKSSLYGMGQKARALAITDATERVADYCEALIEHKCS